MPLRAFLDGLGVPVLLVDPEGNIKTASRDARKILSKDLPEIEGYRPGEVFECANAMLPGGCGKTSHCSGCAIRRTVTDTFETGKSHEKVKAYLKQETGGARQRLSLLISTEKVGEVVLLRIDEMRVEDNPQPGEEIP
jgi:PAS domain-containing protein